MQEIQNEVRDVSRIMRDVRGVDKEKRRSQRHRIQKLETHRDCLRKRIEYEVQSFEGQKEKRIMPKCGMCISCYQKDHCPEEPQGKTCSNYLQPEPSKAEWQEIYTRYLRQAYTEALNGTPEQQCRAIGNARNIRRAMKNIHGFTQEKISEIEKNCGIEREAVKDITGR